jgi:hypothetical protein
MLRKLLHVLPAFLLFYAAAVGLQWRSGAYQSEFGSNPDEPAHYVTGLMVRDYIMSLAPANPMTYARNYYLHYPKVALGHWPPVFYLVQAAWTVPFSASRTSLLLLMAMLTALLATTLSAVIRRCFSARAGIGAGLLMVSLPIIQAESAVVMTEILMSLLVFAAAMSWGRYLDVPDWKHAAWFGGWASLAIMTKGTGFLLALVPVISLLLSRRFRLATRLSFWLPAIMVVVLCGPWYLLVPGAQHESVAPHGMVGFWPSRLRGLPADWLHVGGIALTPFFAIGLVAWFLRFRRKRDADGTWLAAVSLLASIAVFRLLVPAATEYRHMTLAVPALLMFAAGGIAAVLAWGPMARIPDRGRELLLAVALVVVIAVHVLAAPRKDYHGFAAVTHDLLAAPEFRNSVFLVSSDPTGEGMFISEVAMHEKRPGHIVLRGSKVLADSNWTGRTYRPRYRTTDNEMRYLEGIPVGIVIIDLLPREQKEHQTLLRQTIQDYPNRWELLGSYPAHKVLVYRLVGHENRPVGKIRIEMEHNLKRAIEN